MMGLTSLAGSKGRLPVAGQGRPPELRQGAGGGSFGQGICWKLGIKSWLLLLLLLLLWLWWWPLLLVLLLLLLVLLLLVVFGVGVGVGVGVGIGVGVGVGVGVAVGVGVEPLAQKPVSGWATQADLWAFWDSHGNSLG